MKVALALPDDEGEAVDSLRAIMAARLRSALNLVDEVSNLNAHLNSDDFGQGKEKLHDYQVANRSTLCAKSRSSIPLNQDDQRNR